MQPQAQLSIILWVNLGHIHPKLVESFEDEHGYLSLYACNLSGSLLTIGNRTWPFSPTEVKEALDEQRGNFSSTVDFPEDREGELPVTFIFCSEAAKLNPVPEHLPVAVRTGPQAPTLKLVENATPGNCQFPLHASADEDGSSDEDAEEEEAAKAVKIEEVN